VKINGINCTVTEKEHNKENFTVFGAGRIAAAPDQVTVRMGVRKEGVTLIPRFVERTTPEQPSETQEFIATNIVQVRVRELEQLGELLDAAVHTGGNLIGSINFELSEPQQRHTQALEIAMNDARRKAEQLAALAGTQLGAVWSISETDRFHIAA
jgi:uncharacterized protein